MTGQVQQDRCWLDDGLAGSASDPLRWLGARARRSSRYTFDHESFPIGYLREADPGPGPRRRKAAAATCSRSRHRVLLALAALGVVAFRLGRRGQRSDARRALLLPTVIALGGLAVFDDLAPGLAARGLPPSRRGVATSRGGPANGGVVAIWPGALATVALTHAVFFGEDRYHMVLAGAGILAACALRPARESDQPRAAA